MSDAKIAEGLGSAIDRVNHMVNVAEEHGLQVQLSLIDIRRFSDGGRQQFLEALILRPVDVPQQSICKTKVKA